MVGVYISLNGGTGSAFFIYEECGFPGDYIIPFLELAVPLKGYDVIP